MRGRDIAMAVTALLLGAATIVGLFVLVRHFQASMTQGTSPPLPDAGGLLEPVPLVPLEPEPDEDEDASATDATPPKNVPGPPADAGVAGRPPGPRAARDAGFPGLKAERIYIHPASNEQLCIDRWTGRHGYQLHPCRSVKNQRWILEEDPSGVIRIQGGPADCIHVGEKLGNEYVLIPGLCDGTAARFRHEDRRFRELDTNRCLSVHSIERRAQILVSPCDPSAEAQRWGLGR